MLTIRAGFWDFDPACLVHIFFFNYRVRCTLGLSLQENSPLHIVECFDDLCCCICDRHVMMNLKQIS